MVAKEGLSKDSGIADFAKALYQVVSHAGPAIPIALGTPAAIIEQATHPGTAFAEGENCKIRIETYHPDRNLPDSWSSILDRNLPCDSTAEVRIDMGNNSVRSLNILDDRMSTIISIAAGAGALTILLLVSGLTYEVVRRANQRSRLMQSRLRRHT